MGYDPSKELFKVKKKIASKQKDLEKQYLAGNTEKAKAIGQEIDRLQAQKRKYEADVQRFQGPV